MFCGIIVLCGFGVDVKADEVEIDLSIQEAKKMVWLQVNSVIEGNQDVGMWSSDMEVSDCKRLYDCNNNVTAYCVSFNNENGENCGYVVVGADENVAPIVEFATEGEFFSQNNERVYYFGEYDYYVNSGKGDQLENISGNLQEEDKYISERKAKKIKIDGDYDEEWEFFEDNYLDKKQNTVSVKVKGNSVKKLLLKRKQMVLLLIRLKLKMIGLV